jgi:hypothetical protein
VGSARNNKGREEGDVNINYLFEGHIVHKKESIAKWCSQAVTHPSFH